MDSSTDWSRCWAEQARALLLACLAAGACSPPARAPRPPAAPPSPAGEIADNDLAMNAKALCSCVFVQHRDPERFVRQDLRPDPAFTWVAGTQVRVDRLRRRVELRAPGLLPRAAVFHPGLGCTILPRGEDRVFFEPPVLTEAPRARPLPVAPPDPGLELAPDRAFQDPGTRALLVLHAGRIAAERYARGFERGMPLQGWSMGKSLGATLAGIAALRAGTTPWTPPRWRNGRAKTTRAVPSPSPTSCT